MLDFLFAVDYRVLELEWKGLKMKVISGRPSSVDYAY